MRWPWQRREPYVYECHVQGCTKPAEPQDGPFCPDHGWADMQREPPPPPPPVPELYVRFGEEILGPWEDLDEDVQHAWVVLGNRVAWRQRVADGSGDR